MYWLVFLTFCFAWWYQHPGFLIPFIFTLVLLQFFNRQKLSFSIIQIILFMLFSGPFFVVDSFSSIMVFINEFLFSSSKEAITSNFFSQIPLRLLQSYKHLTLKNIQMLFLVREVNGLFCLGSQVSYYLYFLILIKLFQCCLLFYFF